MARRYSAKRKAYRKVRKYKVTKYSKPSTQRASPSLHSINLGYMFPDRVRVTLPYVETIAILGATVTPYEYVFSGNDAYDPNQTGVGHSPMYFDQLAAIYKFYIVRGSTISSIVISSSTGAYTGSARVMTIPRADPAALTASYSVRTIEEQEDTRVKVLGNAASTSHTTTKAYGSTVKMLPGVTEGEIMGQTDGSVAPAQEWYWHYIIASGDDSSTLNLSYQIKIVYNLEFFTRNFMNYS